MVGCCVLGCQNRTKPGLGDVSFHRFPSNAGLAEIWIQACGRYDWRPTRNSRICSGHFNSDLVIRCGKNICLKPGAIPTKNIHTAEFSSNEDQTIILEKSTESLALKKEPRKCKAEEETPLTKKLRKIAENRIKKLRAVRHTNRRLLQRNAELNNTIEELRTIYLNNIKIK